MDNSYDNRRERGGRERERGREGEGGERGREREGGREIGREKDDREQ